MTWFLSNFYILFYENDYIKPYKILSLMYNYELQVMLNRANQRVLVFTWFKYEWTSAWAKFIWTSSEFEFDRDVM